MERFVAECDLMSKRKREIEEGVYALEVLLDNGCTGLQGLGRER